MKDPQDSQEADLRRAFVLMCRDGAEAKTARLELLRPHLEFVAANIDRYLVAGPLRAPQSRTQDDSILGSLFVVDASGASKPVLNASGKRTPSSEPSTPSLSEGSCSPTPRIQNSDTEEACRSRRLTASPSRSRPTLPFA